MQNTLEIAGQVMLNSAGGLESIKELMSVLFKDTTNLIFFQRINEFLNDEIAEFGVNLLGRTMAFVTSIALTLMTLWIMVQGFRIVTGQSRDSMMSLVSNSLRATFIVGIATGWALGGPNIYDWMADGLQANVYKVVTGRDGDVYQDIDRSLGYMQVAFSSIDALQDGADPIINDQKSRAMWFTGIGTGGPAITAGVMLLLNKIAMAIFTGLGPIFVLCLLFDFTKQLFSKWLFYGIGTMFSLAVLSVMVALAMDLVLAVSAAFWVTKFTGGSTEGVTSMAMQQGGLGLILTMLIISAPPIAASFFNGVLGNFTAFSQLGGSAGSQPGARGTGSPPSYASGGGGGGGGGGGTAPSNQGRSDNIVRAAGQPPAAAAQAGQFGVARQNEQSLAYQSAYGNADKTGPSAAEKSLYGTDVANKAYSEIYLSDSNKPSSTQSASASPSTSLPSPAAGKPQPPSGGTA